MIKELKKEFLLLFRELDNFESLINLQIKTFKKEEILNIFECLENTCQDYLDMIEDGVIIEELNKLVYKDIQIYSL